MSKMREALRDAAIAGQKAERNGRPFGMSAIDEIAQRHGDLEFTREEVLKLMEAAGKAQVRDRNDAEIILSRHTEAEGEKLDPIFNSSIVRRLEAIEKRLLADGHAKSCEWFASALRNGTTDVPEECTCGYDNIRESRK